jgi:hypothetical protein
VRLFQSILSILPLAFSRVASSTDSIYGFDKGAFEPPSANRLGPHEDLEGKVASFLRMQEKNGVTAAVAIAYNGSRSSSRSKSMTILQRGFSMQNESSAKTTNTTKFDSQSSSFPAIFLQGTTQPSSPRLLRIRRTNSATKDELRGDNQDSQASRKHTQVQSSDKTTWPHTSWPSLIPLLNEEAGPIMSHSVNGDWHWSQADAETFFYSTSINSNMWFIVLIKDPEESQWSRRRPASILEEEVQHELLETVSSLRFCDIFKRAHVLEIRRGRVEHGSSFSTEAGGEMLLGTTGSGHSDFVELLQSFKEELGLRSPRNKDGFDLSHRFGMMSGRIGRSPRNPRLRGKSAASHHAFFLGEELMTAI